MTSNRPNALVWTARVAAVGFALSVGAYLIVTAQRRAQPSPGSRSETTPSATPSSATPSSATTSNADATSHASALSSTQADATTSGAAATNGAPLAPPAAATSPAPNATMLQSSKVLVLDGVGHEDPTLLFGSKSGPVRTTAPVDDGHVGAAPQDPAPQPVAPPPVLLPTSKSAPPVLLPSSKRLDAPLVPAPKPAGGSGPRTNATAPGGGS